MKVKVGCCGFPGGRKSYFKSFSIAEVQSTFYKLPAKEETVLRWREEAPQGFEFSLKAWQLISHPPTSPTYRKAGIEIEAGKANRYGFLRPTEEVFDAWEKTKHVADLLRARIIVVQCPASFKCTPENIENARKFFASIDRKGVEIAWEPRGNWLERPEAIKRVVDDLNLIHCVDPLWDEPQSKHPIAYFRLHGKGKRYNYRYVYTDLDLKELADKVRAVGKGEVYVLFNNLAMGQNAAQFTRMMLA
jgi:uncharacterized protein YecE (DUF72 family)